MQCGLVCRCEKGVAQQQADPCGSLCCAPLVTVASVRAAYKAVRRPHDLERELPQCGLGALLLQWIKQVRMFALLCDLHCSNDVSGGTAISWFRPCMPGLKGQHRLHTAHTVRRCSPSTAAGLPTGLVWQIMDFALCTSTACWLSMAVPLQPAVESTEVYLSAHVLETWLQVVTATHC